MKLLGDYEAFDDEIINRLIKILKIPLPSLQNPQSQKEILFPARIIYLVVKQMWKYGLRKEYERLFAKVMMTIQERVNDFEEDDTILPGAYWFSNVHELLSFANAAKKDMLREADSVSDSGKNFEWQDYEKLVSIIKQDLESLEYNIYCIMMKELKKRLYKMVIPAIIESQSLPGFIAKDSMSESNRFMKTLITVAPSFSMDDLLDFLGSNEIILCRNGYYSASVISTVGNEWCKNHEIPEGTLQLEHLLEATKLLQQKKRTLGDIEVIYDQHLMLTPSQIFKLISNYFPADYEVEPIGPEILKHAACRCEKDKNDFLLLHTTPLEDPGPFEVPLPRELDPPDNYIPT
ncbi:32899_t:CDS:2, partial [Gigaspora margarita]